MPSEVDDEAIFLCGHRWCFGGSDVAFPGISRDFSGVWTVVVGGDEMSIVRCRLFVEKFGNKVNFKRKILRNSP